MVVGAAIITLLGCTDLPVIEAGVCGNAVIVKPSEHTPRTGAWFVARLAEHLPAGVIQCVQMNAAAICENGPTTCAGR